MVVVKKSYNRACKFLFSHHILSIALVVLFCEFFFACRVAAFYKESIYFLISAPSILLAVYACYCAAKNDIKKATCSLIISCITLLPLLIFMTGGLRAPGLSWIVILPLLIGALIDSSKISTMSAIGCLGILLVFYILDQQNIVNGLMDESTYNSEKVVNVLFQIILFYSIIRLYSDKVTKANKELEIEKQQTSTLLRIVIHDLSSPLTVVKTVAKREALNMSEKNGKMLVKNTQAITDILNSVREFKSFQDNKINFNSSNVELSEILEDVESMFQLKADKKSINLIVYNQVPFTVVNVDLVVFKNQVINNLISNSLKFTHENGTVSIHATLDETKKFVMIKVQDNGVGIPDELKDDLFSFTTQTSRFGTNGEVGTGYGLPMVKYFVDCLGGELSVQSSEKEEDHGTQFVVKIPVVKV